MVLTVISVFVDDGTPMSSPYGYAYPASHVFIVNWMANKHVRDTKLHQSHMTLALNNNPSWSNKNKIKSSRTRDHEQYVHTIKTYQNSQINQSTGTPSSTKKHYTLDSHNQRQWQTRPLTLTKPQHTRDNLELLSFTKIPAKRHTQEPSPTFLIREVLTVF